MNDLPLLFAESVARLIDFSSHSSLIETSFFKKFRRSLWEKSLYVTLSVLYNPVADTFDYCTTCTRNYGSFWPAAQYTFDPADHRFVSEFKVNLLKNKLLLDVDVDVTWTTATPSDPTFLKLLRAPFARTQLILEINCPQLMNLLQDYCTFNYIYNYAFNHSQVLDEIIRRSQACGRLERLYCKEFFRKRGMEASIEWIATNKRLTWIGGYFIKNHGYVRSALNRLGVQ